MLADSPTKYPQISWEATNAFLDRVYSGNSALSNYKKVQRSQVELCFIGATRTDDTKGLKSAMQRSELLDFLLRLAIQFLKANFETREPLSHHLQFFFNSYVRRITEESPIERHRRIIWRSTVLNEFLFDNHEGLNELYLDAKRSRGHGPLANKFTIEAANRFFSPLKGETLNDYGPLLLNSRLIEDSFIYSQMSIWNEHDDNDKYLYLHFVEFQEMLCRIANGAVNTGEDIEVKVYLLV